MADGTPLDGVHEGLHVFLGDEEELQAAGQIKVALRPLLVEVVDAGHGRTQEILGKRTDENKYCQFVFAFKCCQVHKVQLV